MRTTTKQAGAILLALVVGAILLVWTALLSTMPESAGAQEQEAQSEEIRMTGKGGNELVVTADRVTITSDDVMVTREARNTGQVQDSSGAVGDEEDSSEPKVGSDETGALPEDPPVQEAESGSPTDGEDAAAEEERETVGEGTTSDGSSTEEPLSEEGPKPEALLRTALEECAVVVSEDEEDPDDDLSEEAASERTTTTRDSKTDEASDGEQPSEGPAEETVPEEQRDFGKGTPDEKTADKEKDGKKARQEADKTSETIPVVDEEPTGAGEITPEVTTGETTAEEAQAGDSATDTTRAEETTTTEETAAEETSMTGEDTSEKEGDETEQPDDPALGLTLDDCEKMFIVIAEYNELYDAPAEYDNDEEAQQEATPGGEPAESESTESDNGVDGDDAGGRTVEGATPGEVSREEQVVRPEAAGTEEADGTKEEAKEEESTGETTAPGQGSEKNSGFAFRTEEESGEDSTTATPEGGFASRDRERKGSALTEPPAGSRSVDGEDGAVGEATSGGTAAEKTTTDTAEEAPNSSSWGQRSPTTKNIALPEQKTSNGTRAVLPKTGGPTLGAFATLAAQNARLPLSAILGVLSVSAGIVLLWLARRRRDSPHAGDGRDEQDEGIHFRRDA